MATKRLGSLRLGIKLNKVNARLHENKSYYIALVVLLSVLCSALFIPQALAATATITSPSNNAYVAGSVPIIGSASNNYKLEYGAGATPATWTQFATGVIGTNITLGTLNTTTLANGDYTIRLTLTKGTVVSTQILVHVDNTKPTGTITTPANNSKVAGTLTITGTASDTNFANYKLEYGAGTSPASWTTINSSTAPITNGTLGTLNTLSLIDGDYTIRLTATDLAANSTAASSLVHVDNAIPTTMLYTNPPSPDGQNGWFKSATTITLSASEPGTINYRWDTDSNDSVFTGPIPAREGSHTLYYYTVDNTGNTEVTKSQIIKVDTTPPSAPALSSPPNGNWLITQHPDLSWDIATDASSGIANYVVKIDGSTDQTVSATTLSVSTMAALSEGAHDWQVVAVDGAGHETPSLSRTIKLDLTNPTAVIASPANNSQVSNTITFTGTASDTNFANYKLEYGAGVSPASWATITDTTTAVSNNTLGTLDTFALTNGDYTVKLTATDAVGKNTATSILVTVANDHTPPTTMLFTDPVAADGNNDWFKSETTITLTASEPATIRYKWETDTTYTVYGGPFKALEGNHALSYYSVDSKNNTEMVNSKPIKVDITPPTAPALSSPADGGWQSTQHPTLSWNAATDASSGIANYVVKIDGSTDQTVSATTTQVPTLATLSEDAHTWQVIAIDNAGHESQPSSRTVKIDTADPVAAITSPSSNMDATRTVTIAGSASDTHFANYKLEYGAGVSPSAWNTIVNSSTPVTDGILGTFNTAGLANGTYTIKLTVTDNAGKVSTASVVINIVNDVAAPTTTLFTSPPSINGQNGWFTSQVTVNLVSSEPGPTNYKWEADAGYKAFIDPVPAQEGSHTISFYSVDIDGNIEAAKSRTVKVDTVDPTAPALSSPADGGWQSTQHPTLSWNAATDASSGIANYVVKIDGSTDQTVSATTTQVPTLATLSEDAHTWQVIAIDNAGHESQPSSRTVKIDTADPTATVSSPANNEQVSGNLTIMGTASDTNFTNYKLEYGAGASPSSWTTINNSSTPVTNGTLGTLNTSGLANGDYTIKLTVNDGASKFTSLSILVKLGNDTTPPTTTLTTSPVSVNGNNGWFKSATTITLKSNEPGYTYYKWETDQDYSTCMGQIPAPEGSHTLYYYSVDSKNNTETVKWQTISVDTVAPEKAPSLIEPFNNIWISNQSPLFKWNSAYDANSGVVKYKLMVDNAPNKEVVADTALDTIYSTTPANPLGADTHSWQVIAEDAAGNQKTSGDPWTSMIDTVDPTVSMGYPKNNSTVAGTLDITGTATDAHFEKYVLEYGSGKTPTAWTKLSEVFTPVSNGKLGSIDTLGLSNSVYTIKLTAFDITGRSSTASINVTVDNGDPSPPSVPLNIKAIPLNTGSIYISWDASTDNVGVKEYKVCDGTNDTIVLGTTTNTNFTATGLQAAKQYSFCVKAFDARGNSSKSQVVTATTFANQQTVDAQNTRPQLGGGITLSFPAVTTQGTINVVGSGITPTGLPAPKGKAISYFDVVLTNVTYTGNVLVTVKYDKASVGDDSNLRMWHYDNSAKVWVNVTQQVDKEKCEITGSVPSFSWVSVTSGNEQVLTAMGMNTDSMLMISILLMSIGGYLLYTKRPNSLFS